MIRVEALNHDGGYDLIGLFEEFQKSEIKACIEENENYYLRVVETGKARKLLWQNF